MECKKCGGHLPFGTFGQVKCEYCNTSNRVPIPGEGEIQTDVGVWQVKRRYSHLREDLPRPLKAFGYPMMALFNTLGFLGYMWIDFIQAMNQTNQVTRTPIYIEKIRR